MGELVPQVQVRAMMGRVMTAREVAKVEGGRLISMRCIRGQEGKGLTLTIPGWGRWALTLQATWRSRYRALMLEKKEEEVERDAIELEESSQFVIQEITA